MNLVRLCPASFPFVAWLLGGFSGALIPTPAPGQTVAAAVTTPAAPELIDRLKQAPGRIEDVDGRELTAGEVQLARDWSGDSCASRLINTGKFPLRIGNIILFDSQSHGLDPATPMYGEGFQMLAQTSGPIAKPNFFGSYPDAKHYHIPQPDNLPTAYGIMTLDLGGEGQALLDFTSCRRFIGRFSFDARVLRVSLDPEGLELRPGETWKLEEFLAVSPATRSTTWGHNNSPPCASWSRPPAAARGLTRRATKRASPIWVTVNIIMRSIGRSRPRTASFASKRVPDSEISGPMKTSASTRGFTT